MNEKSLKIPPVVKKDFKDIIELSVKFEFH